MERAKPARLAKRGGVGGWGWLELPTSIPGAQTPGRWGRLLAWGTDSQGSRENHQKFIKTKPRRNAGTVKLSDLVQMTHRHKAGPPPRL